MMLTQISLTLSLPLSLSPFVTLVRSSWQHPGNLIVKLQYINQEKNATIPKPTKKEKKAITLGMQYRDSIWCTAEHCWRSKDELISDVLLWTPTYGQAKAGRPARTYIQQLCEDTGCSPEDLPETMNDREKWRERVRDIRASGMMMMMIWCTYQPEFKWNWLMTGKLLSVCECVYI